MKQIIACLVGICLLSPVELRVAHGDMIPGPQRPERPDKPVELQQTTRAIPLYAVAAGVAAVAMTGSLIALRVVRKRNDKQPD
jgi:hypothetical protein